MLVQKEMIFFFSLFSHFILLDQSRLEKKVSVVDSWKSILSVGDENIVKDTKTELEDENHVKTKEARIEEISCSIKRLQCQL